MRILVTGATGFIGSTLCRRLCERGDEVIAFHRFTSSLDQIADLPLQRVIGDITDDASVETAFNTKPEVVIHLAAQQVSGRNPDKLMEVNVGGTRRVFQAAFHAGVSKIILMSSALTMGYSDAASGLTAAPMPVTETHHWGDLPEEWTFAWSKLLAEREAQWASAYGMRIAICSPLLVIGPGDHYRRRTSLIARYRSDPPQYTVDGGINLIHVQDVVNGILGAIEYGEDGQRYLLSGENISFDRFFKLLSELTHTPPPRIQLPTGLSNCFNTYKFNHPDLFPVGEVDNDILLYAGKYFYFNGENSRLALHLPPPRAAKEAIQNTLDWFDGAA